MGQSKAPRVLLQSTAPRTKRISSRKRKRGEGTPVTSRYFQKITQANGSFRFAAVVSPDSKIRTKRATANNNTHKCINVSRSLEKIAPETEIAENEKYQSLGCALFEENRGKTLVDANGATSDYFLRSPSSAYGSIQSLGPLVYTWIDSSNRDEIHLNCSRLTSSSDNNGKPCDTCSKILMKDAFRHFRDCPVFREKLDFYSWNSNRTGSSDHAGGNNRHSSCVEVVGRWAEEHALRHLCPNQCFLRAFAPSRDWMVLRKNLKKVTPIGEILKDWTCRLVHETEANGDENLVSNRALLTRINCSEIEEVKKNLNVKHSLRGRLPRTIFVSLKTGESYVSFHKGQKRILEKYSQQSDANNQVVIDRNSKVSIFDENHYKATELKAGSPFGLVEELFPEEPWRVLICTMLLNKTQRKQNLDSILYYLFDRWPTPDSVVKDAECNEEDVHLFVFALVRAAGLGQSKARAFVHLSKDYLLLLRSKSQINHDNERCAGKGIEFELTREDVKQLFNCGDYAADAYQIFIRKDFESPIFSSDQMLLAYVEWKRSLSCVV